MFGVRTPTIARWAREGRLVPIFTPGGHRRYTRQEVRRALAAPEQEDQDQLAADAVRLYEQGWNIRQVADRFGMSYGVMRRLLQKHTTLRNRSSQMPAGPPSGLQGIGRHVRGSSPENDQRGR